MQLKLSSTKKPSINKPTDNYFTIGKLTLSKPVLVIVILSILTLAFSALYLFTNLGSRPLFVLDLRWPTVVSILLVSICVGYSTVVFQTTVNAKILTPGILGFENIYMFIQTFVVFIAATGTNAYLITGPVNFFISVVTMVFFSLLIFLPLLLKGSRAVFKLLLIGMILSTLFASLTTFMQMRIDPNEFFIVQGRMFASFDNPNITLMWVSAIIAAIALAFTPSSQKLDVLNLGRDVAIGLGVNHKTLSIRILVIVSVLVSVSVALVGPVMFLGLLVANLSYQVLKSYKHTYTITGAVLICALSLILAQFLIRRVISNFLTINIPVLINFLGGIYFIFLLIRERKNV